MKRPRISTNLAISADGKISSVPPRPAGWGSEADHERLLDLRKSADALLVGRGTLAVDRMTMTVPGNGPQPLRCVVSRSGKYDPAHPLFHQPGGAIHLLTTGDEPGEEIAGATSHHGSLADFLSALSENHAVRRLHCEGGGQLIRALAELDFIDDFHLTIAGHKLFGGRGAATATGVPGNFLPQSLAFTNSHFEARPELGECFLTYSRVR